jgi:small-conductance mechanosensitive channel
MHVTRPSLWLQATTAPLTIVDSIKASLTGAFAMMFSAIPRVLGFIIILLVGWLIASLVARAVQAILHTVKFNAVAERIGIAEFVRKMGDADPSALVAGALKRLIRVVVLLVAFDALGLNDAGQTTQLPSVRSAIGESFSGGPSQYRVLHSGRP